MWLAVKNLLEKGDFQLFDSGANLFYQVFWQALFCLPFGFSFDPLRFSTLTLGLVGVVAIYGLLREVNANQKISLIGALLVAINPVYFELANTFTTDVPFFAFATLSIYFLIRGLRYNSNIGVIIGTLLTYIAVLIRQVGLAIPLRFLVAYIVKKGLSLRSFIIGCIPGLLGFTIQIIYQKCLELTSRLPPTHNLQATYISKELSKGVGHVILFFINNALVALIYLGLFIAPFLIVLVPSKLKELSSQQKSLTLMASSFFSVVALGVLASERKRMPLSENILIDFGLGPATLRDTFILKLPHLPTAPKIVWWVITAIGIVAAALLFLYLFFAILQIFNKELNGEFIYKRWIAALSVSTVFIYFFPQGIAGCFERYLIPLLPFLMMIVVVSTKNISSWKIGYKSMSIAIIMMLLCAGFSIGATHDYLSWNRVRWQALNNLVQEAHISPDSIDGGYEFNGWYLFDSKYKERPTKSWWWVDNDDYMISFGPITGYQEVKRYSFRGWLPFGQGNIFVLHKATKSSGITEPTAAIY